MTETSHYLQNEADYDARHGNTINPPDDDYCSNCGELECVCHPCSEPGCDRKAANGSQGDHCAMHEWYSWLDIYKTALFESPADLNAVWEIYREVKVWEMRAKDEAAQ